MSSSAAAVAAEARSFSSLRLHEASSRNEDGQDWADVGAVPSAWLYVRAICTTQPPAGNGNGRYIAHLEAPLMKPPKAKGPSAPFSCMKPVERTEMDGTGRVWGLSQVCGSMSARFEPPNRPLVTEMAVTSRILRRR